MRLLQTLFRTLCTLKCPQCVTWLCCVRLSDSFHVSHRKLLVGDAYSKVGLNHPHKDESFLPSALFCSGKKRDHACVWRCRKENTPSCLLCFLGCSLLRIAHWTSNFGDRAGKMATLFAFRRFQGRKLSGRGCCGTEWPQEAPLLVRELRSSAWDIIPFRVV